MELNKYPDNRLLHIQCGSLFLSIMLFAVYSLFINGIINNISNNLKYKNISIKDRNTAIKILESRGD